MIKIPIIGTNYFNRRLLSRNSWLTMMPLPLTISIDFTWLSAILFYSTACYFMRHGINGKVVCSQRDICFYRCCSYWSWFQSTT